ncbi:hypothetical protein Tco_0247680 [Tanacetum coccineum]
MAAAMVGDSNLEKMLSAEIVNKMSPSSSANNKKVLSPFYSEDSSSEDEWEEDAEVEVEVKEKDTSTVKRLSRYSLGYLDFSDHQEGRVEKTLWYKLMVKHNNIIPKNRPPPPPPPQPTPPPPPPPRRLRAFMRYAQDPLTNCLSGRGRQPLRGGTASHPALTI